MPETRRARHDNDGHQINGRSWCLELINGVPETQVRVEKMGETLIFNVSNPTLELFRPAAASSQSVTNRAERPSLAGWHSSGSQRWS